MPNRLQALCTWLEKQALAKLNETEARLQASLSLMDITTNIKLLQARLKGRHFEATITASNGRKALETCTGHRIDVIFIDVIVPGMKALICVAAPRPIPRHRIFR